VSLALSSSHEIHGVLHSSLSFVNHLDIVLLILAQVRTSGHRSIVTIVCQLVVMTPGPVCHQVGVVSGGGIGDCPGAPAVQMTEVVRQHFQLVCGEIAVVQQNLITTGSAGASDPFMAEEVEVPLSSY